MHQSVYVNICTFSLCDIFFYIYTGNTHSQTHTFSFSLFVNHVYTYIIKPVFLENSVFFFFFKFCEKESEKNENQVWKAAGPWHHSNGQMKDAVPTVPAPLIHYCFQHTLGDMFSPAFSPETHICLA